MTKAVGQDGAMIDSLKEVTKLFEEAQLSVFKLMASVSILDRLMSFHTNSLRRTLSLSS
jgi:methanogenic corrinoid protein MtbC1